MPDENGQVLNNIFEKLGRFEGRFTGMEDKIDGLVASHQRLQDSTSVRVSKLENDKAKFQGAALALGGFAGVIGSFITEKLFRGKVL